MVLGPRSPSGLKVNLPELPIDGIELDGTAQVHRHLSGSLNDPSIEGALTTDGVRVRVMQMREAAEVSAQVDFTGHDFSIRDPSGQFRRGNGDNHRAGSWQGEGQLQFRVDNLRPENFAKGRPVSGVAGIEGEFDIRSPVLKALAGT